MSRPPSTPDSPTASTPRSRSPATSSLLTTPRRTAAATSSDCASVTRRPPSNRTGTPSRSSHSVMRLPPPWTSTTGRCRATAATSASTCACSAIVVPPSLTTRISLTSCARQSRRLAVLDHVLPRSGRSRTPRRAVAQAQVEPDQRLRRRPSPRATAARSNSTGAAVEPSNTSVPGDRDRAAGRDPASPAWPRAPRGLGLARPAASRTAASGQPGVAGRAGDAAPVRVPAVDRGLDQAARHDRPRHGPRLGVVVRAASPGT